MSAGVIQQGQQGQDAPGQAGGAKGGAAANPEEVDLDMDDGEDEGTNAAVGGGEDEEEGGAVQVKAVPASVYGSLASAAGGNKRDEEEGQQGAMDRLKKRRVG